MEGQPIPGENEMKDEDVVSPPLAPFVYDAALEKQRQFVAERMRKKENRTAANDAVLPEEKDSNIPEEVEDPLLPYIDRDDNELEKDENGEWVMKKYRNV
jgi:hypothetical protein